MKRLVAIAALVAVPTLFGAPAFAASSAAASKIPSATVAAGYETEVVRLTNVQRTAHGCAALRIDDRLITAARAHSSDMIAENFFSHTGSNGSNFVDREAAAGYPRKSASAENIAWGYRTPADVVNAWMHSAGHRANILNCASKAVGVGVAYTGGGAPYWTQDFGRS
ncbi:CAP domain-containing protein [Actinoplanes sp. CA-030573]|uniref:CAP domain-containing protein n=1 Tax=Actinoplanes sp. CA-030573 TaxID=3239898 RepID=UPI003D9393B1